MAKATNLLIEKLREAAANLENGAVYNWGNATRCNCAHLVQCFEVDDAQVAFKRINHALDEWTEFANDYCPYSGRPTDQLIDTLYENGMTHQDIRQLEYLSNTEVLRALPGGFRYLQHGNRHDVALYMRTWAALLEQQLIETRSNVVEAAPTSVI